MLIVVVSTFSGVSISYVGVNRVVKIFSRAVLALTTFLKTLSIEGGQNGIRRVGFDAGIVSRGNFKYNH